LFVIINKEFISYNFVLDWTKLYPILSEYQKTVDCELYHNIFTEMIKEMGEAYNYSLEDTVLVLKDLLYKVSLEMQKVER